MDFKFATRTLILAVASSSFALAAVAQWQWIDKGGRKVFSDRAPSADIPQKNILKQPGAKALSPSPAIDAATAPTPTAMGSVAAGKTSAPKLSGKDAQLEARKKQTADEEDAKKKAEEEKLTKAKADNCERAQKGLATVQSGVRLSVTNAKGEREFMDDRARAAESKRLQGIADSDCAK
jgi:type IV secretory pathway VirB10-like protein